GGAWAVQGALRVGVERAPHLPLARAENGCGLDPTRTGDLSEDVGSVSAVLRPDPSLPLRGNALGGPRVLDLAHSSDCCRRCRDHGDLWSDWTSRDDKTCSK